MKVPPSSTAVRLSDREATVLKLICEKPIDVDGIIVGAKMKAGETLNILLSLELQGHIRQLPGKLFVRSE
jgi:predicted Rossmann fold nucleotide-binding protein DprA/Smf involved in DNA uptake